MREAVIVEAVRTPVGKGKPGGALAEWHPVDLLATTLNELVERAGLEPERVDDVVGGCVTQYGQQSLNVTRSAVLAAGWPDSIPATTIDRQCGSSQQAVHFAAQAVMAGAQDVVVACGVEMMSRVPMLVSAGDQDPYGSLIAARYPGGLISQGISAELIAAKWGLTREQLDEFAARSHVLADEATRTLRFASELLPVSRDGVGGTENLVTTDEGIRPGTTVESLGALRPAFWSDENAARHPEAEWVIHAGNASQISDGAAAVLVMERGLAERQGLRIRARIHTMDVVGDDPILMLTGVIPATLRALVKARLTIDEIDLFEVNEAFAPVVLAWLAETGAELERVNVNGGAIALGHPLGASGAKLMTTLVHELERRGGRFGLQTMCEGGGMANATILERVA